MEEDYRLYFNRDGLTPPAIANSIQYSVNRPWHNLKVGTGLAMPLITAQRQHVQMPEWLRTPSNLQLQTGHWQLVYSIIIIVILSGSTNDSRKRENRSLHDNRQKSLSE